MENKVVTTTVNPMTELETAESSTDSIPEKHFVVSSARKVINAIELSSDY